MAPMSMDEVLLAEPTDLLVGSPKPCFDFQRFRYLSWMNSNGPRAPRHDPCEVTSGVTMRLQGPHHSAPRAWPAHGRTRDVTPPASSPAAPARSSAGKGPGCEAHSIATAPNVTARCGVEGPHFVTKAPDDRDQPRHMPTRSHGWLWQTVGSAQLTKNVRNRTSCVFPPMSFRASSRAPVRVESSPSQ